MKNYKEIYAVGNNSYSILDYDDELYLATESFLPIERKLFSRWLKPKKLIQGFKVLELTAPILILLNEMLDCKIVSEDKEFADMTTYEKINNKDLRMTIETLYNSALEEQIKDIKDNFNMWVSAFTEQSQGKSESEINGVIETNRNRVNTTIERMKETYPLNMMSLIVPKGSSDNQIVKKMVQEGIDFLYTQKVGSNLQISYLYDMDCFGSITIYKVQIVKGVVKSIETFLYNINIAEEVSCYVSNNVEEGL